MPPQEVIDAGHRLLEIVVGGRIAEAHKAPSALPERRARHDSHALLDEERFGEREVILDAAGADVREDIEGAVRLDGGKAHGLQAPIYEAAAAVVLGHHA